MFICKYCKDDPQLHTFRIHDELDNHTVFYSCIAESTDKNVTQIVYHINGFLEEHMKTNKTWSWIIDSKNFSIEWHSLSLTIELIGLYKKYQSTITEIRVRNLNGWMKEFLEMCIPFMSSSLQSILKIETETAL
jgi:hypothetical protein